MDIGRARFIDGWMFESELETLATWASKYNKIIEVGSWKGRSTRAICDNMEGIVVAVDHWEGPKDIENYKEEFSELIENGSDSIYRQFRSNLLDHIKSGKLIIVKKTSKNASTYLKRNYGENFFDMVFIDCDHSYEGTRDDILRYLPLIRLGGMICGHDFNWPGVEKAVKELFPDYSLVGNMWYKIL